MDTTYPGNLPPEIAAIVRSISSLTQDPVAKLRFIRSALKRFSEMPGSGTRLPFFASMAFRMHLGEEVRAHLPECEAEALKLIQKGGFPGVQRLFWVTYRVRFVLLVLLPVLLVLGVSLSMASVMNTISSNRDQLLRFLPFPRAFDLEALSSLEGVEKQGVSGLAGNGHVDGVTFLRNEADVQPAAAKKDFRNAVDGRLPTGSSDGRDNGETQLASAAAIAGQQESPEKEAPAERVAPFVREPIWLVERSPTGETYSNRLQIITAYEVDSVPRQYVPFKRGSDDLPGVEGVQSEIRGILYHSSESDLLPMLPEKNHSLLRYSRILRSYIAKKHCYNYFIDRFGRVYRIVRDDQAANHAGNSIWADAGTIYLNLNHAFLGICFEGKGFEQVSVPGRNRSRMMVNDDMKINEAQIKSGRELTDWLRYRYRIHENNCVPHGLVSVNPHNGLIGYHLDLSHGFPFNRFGLSNKYDQPLPSITEFGFSHDGYLESIFNGRLWPGIAVSEKILEEESLSQGLPLPEAVRQKRVHFSDLVAWQESVAEELEKE